MNSVEIWFSQNFGCIIKILKSLFKLALYIKCFVNFRIIFKETILMNFGLVNSLKQMQALKRQIFEGM